jgi:hypothetical protein
METKDGKPPDGYYILKNVQIVKFSKYDTDNCDANMTVVVMKIK